MYFFLSEYAGKKCPILGRSRRGNLEMGFAHFVHPEMEFEARRLGLLGLDFDKIINSIRKKNRASWEMGSVPPPLPPPQPPFRIL